jgi:ureidoglycolate lyase
MKLMRTGRPGIESPTLLADDGSMRDLSEVVDDISGPALSPAVLRTIAGLDWRALPVVPPATRIGPCVTGMRNFVCIGANYADAVAEQGKPAPKEPVLFLKSLSAICGPNDDLVMPPGSVKTDWEVELGVVIGEKAAYVSEADAMRYVCGYCVCNDLSEREYQYDHGPTWDKGKGFDTFGPIGPWLVTKDEVTDPRNLNLWLDVDGSRMQTGNTKTMIFDIPRLIAYVSAHITLYPGDIISTGTPPGGGIARKPAVFLKAGKEMRCGIDGLGEHRQRTVESRAVRGYAGA